MEMYIKFMTWLTVGMFGLGMVLKVLMDELLNDYDAPAALGQWVRDVASNRSLMHHHRAEDMLMEMEKAKTTEGAVRRIDQRREQLRELASVERRLSAPPASGGPIVLTPLPPIRYPND